MRTTKEALTIRVVVRRTGSGVGKYRWEIHAIDTVEPIHVSTDSFTGMEAAFRAGQARLEEFIPKRSMAPGETANRQWQSLQFGRPGSQQDSKWAGSNGRNRQIVQ